MAAEANADTDAATSGARGTTGNYTHGGDTEFARENSDIGIEEAWSANVKRTYDTLEEELQAAVKESQAHVSELRTIRVQMLSNMAVNCDALQKQHTAHRDISTDRTWTASNELEAALAAKSGVQADAMVTLLAKAISDALTGAK